MDEVIKIDLKSEGRAVIKTGMQGKAGLIFPLPRLFLCGKQTQAITRCRGARKQPARRLGRNTFEAQWLILQ